jgi:hypothetical protein
MSAGQLLEVLFWWFATLSGGQQTSVPAELEGSWPAYPTRSRGLNSASALTVTVIRVITFVLPVAPAPVVGYGISISDCELELERSD